ncbi:MAG TPA: phosphopentomutase [Solirubrobacteraceae bacterium]
MSPSPARRAFVLVIDACGAGALPDAADYGDEGTNTLSHLAQAAGGLRLPVMQALGLGSILDIDGVPPSPGPAIHGRLAPLGPGKDSITGHWELMGVSLPAALPTYPEGFPEPLVRRLEKAIGREMICNRPDNGLAAIEHYGAEHLRSGALILYTSQDSVLQLAGHVEVIGEAELYEACERARELMSGSDGVGRVIARPFTGRPGAFERTPGRRDFSLAPPGPSYLEEIERAGLPVTGVGKIGDLFAGRGISATLPGVSNEQALESVAALAGSMPAGFAFANLIETDQRYGHRKDVEGFARALEQIDERVGELVAALGEGDLLIVTADHGVDPLHPGSDHTREHAPLLALTGAMARAGAAGGSYGGRRHDGPMADVGASVLWWLTGGAAPALPGRSFLS